VSKWLSTKRFRERSVVRLRDPAAPHVFLGSLIPTRRNGECRTRADVPNSVRCDHRGPFRIRIRLRTRYGWIDTDRKCFAERVPRARSHQGRPFRLGVDRVRNCPRPRFAGGRWTRRPVPSCPMGRQNALRRRMMVKTLSMTYWWFHLTKEVTPAGPAQLSLQRRLTSKWAA